VPTCMRLSSETEARMLGQQACSSEQGVASRSTWARLAGDTDPILSCELIITLEDLLLNLFWVEHRVHQVRSRNEIYC
jgi:hypothetical protein